MNSLWNKNLSLFKNRFPPLYEIMKSRIQSFEKNYESGVRLFSVSEAKNGSLTASENGIRLHSAYNPEREADSLVSSLIKNNPEAENLVFFSCGLGYSLFSAAKLFSNCSENHLKNLILAEPVPEYFFEALASFDFEEIFKLSGLVIALSCPPDQMISILNHYGILKSAFVISKPLLHHDEAYFNALNELVERNRRKEEINNATTKKFGKRWNANCLKNAEKAFELDGINIFKDKARGLPFTVVAAGPSLQKLLPHFEEIKKRSVIVCVDTSLRAMLSVKVQPDFIILTDPQYWAFRHISGLKAPDSILVTASDVYPDVLRFGCRKIVCCSSQLPVGQFFEKRCGVKGDLGAGGSVSSCAWNFAEFCGSSEIYCGGLDLAFPRKQTHIRGSSFEQNAHVNSIKTKSAETLSMPLLFSGNPVKAADYLGNEVLTDHRMKMFAWWFESRLAECPDVKTYTLSAEGLKIPGIMVSSVEKLLELPEITEKKQQFLEKSLKLSKTPEQIQKSLELYRNAEKEFQERTKDVDFSDFEAVKKSLED